jgi:hypothetical protein
MVNLQLHCIDFHLLIIQQHQWLYHTQYRLTEFSIPLLKKIIINKISIKRLLNEILYQKRLIYKKTFWPNKIIIKNLPIKKNSQEFILKELPKTNSLPIFKKISPVKNLLMKWSIKKKCSRFPSLLLWWILQIFVL